MTLFRWNLSSISSFFGEYLVIRLRNAPCVGGFKGKETLSLVSVHWVHFECAVPLKKGGIISLPCVKWAHDWGGRASDANEE